MSLQVISAEQPTAFELLDKYAETQDKLKSFILKYDDEGSADIKHNLVPGFENRTLVKGGYFGKLRSDGSSHYFSQKLWGDQPPEKPDRKSAELDPRSLSFLWDGVNMYQYMRSNASPEQDLLFLHPQGQPEARGDGIISTCRSSVLFGYFRDTFARTLDDYKRIDAELRQAGTISVQDQMKDVNGSKCWFITARTKTSKYKIWIDPEHGYNIAKAEIFRKWGGSDLHRPGEISLFTYLRNVQFKMVDGVWVAVEADYGYKWKLIKHGYSNADHHHKITEFILNPDHKALGSFKPSYIRNGTTTHIIGIKGITYRWKDGCVVDKSGKVIMDCRLKEPVKKD